MELKRGFKTEAETIAREVRSEMGLASYEPLSPWNLAEHLGVPLLRLSALVSEAPTAVEFFLADGRGAFSAVTVLLDTKRLVVYNDGHSLPRQASDLSHELAHALLLHPPHAAMDENGCRVWAAEIEREAEWLGGALLVPRDAAFRIARRRLLVEDAAQEYGVSDQMMRFRLNVTGAQKVAAIAKRA